MPKFEVIEGNKDKVTSIQELRELEITVSKIENTLTYKGLFVYAYHFIRLGHSRRAQELLDKIAPITLRLDFIKICTTLYFVGQFTRV